MKNKFREQVADGLKPTLQRAHLKATLFSSAGQGLASPFLQMFSFWPQPDQISFSFWRNRNAIFRASVPKGKLHLKERPKGCWAERKVGSESRSQRFHHLRLSDPFLSYSPALPPKEWMKTRQPAASFVFILLFRWQERRGMKIRIKENPIGHQITGGQCLDILWNSIFYS